MEPEEFMFKDSSLRMVTTSSYRPSVAHMAFAAMTVLTVVTLCGVVANPKQSSSQAPVAVTSRAGEKIVSNRKLRSTISRSNHFPFFLIHNKMERWRWLMPYL